MSLQLMKTVCFLIVTYLRAFNNCGPIYGKLCVLLVLIKVVLLKGNVVFCLACGNVSIFVKTLFLQVLANINIYLLARFCKLTQFDDNSFSACIAKCYLTFRKQSVLAAFKICGKTF